MIVAFFSLILGLALLLWSADRFIEGSASLAAYLGMPPLLIGMVIVGFGTSAPELLVSSLAALDGNAGIALGNVYGSNIANIALILGFTALLNPIRVRSSVLRKELLILAMVTAVSILLVTDLRLSRIDSAILLLIFSILIVWSIHKGLKQETDSLGMEMETDRAGVKIPPGGAVFRIAYGLVLLIASSRVLVWGSVRIARIFGVSDMIIGLTIVAIGTSLPEFASSMIAARKGEHDIAFGNIIGSNLFNTLAVTGLAGMLHPFVVEAETLFRDMTVMGGFTLSLFLVGYGFRGRPGRINRYEGAALLAVYTGYLAVLIGSTLRVYL